MACLHGAIDRATGCMYVYTVRSVGAIGRAIGRATDRATDRRDDRRDDRTV